MSILDSRFEVLTVIRTLLAQEIEEHSGGHHVEEGLQREETLGRIH